jgi:hypothetical protein
MFNDPEKTWDVYYRRSLNPTMSADLQRIEFSRDGTTLYGSDGSVVWSTKDVPALQGVASAPYYSHRNFKLDLPDVLPVPYDADTYGLKREFRNRMYKARLDYLDSILTSGNSILTSGKWGSSFDDPCEDIPQDNGGELDKFLSEFHIQNNPERSDKQE